MTDTVPPPARDQRITQAHLPGDGAMWVMVLGDLIIFGAYFVIYMVHRAMAPQAFLADQQHLDLTVGAANTVVLLTSSWLIARGVAAARDDRCPEAVRLTVAAGGLGVAFIAVKAYEWSVKVAGGHTLGGSEFFTFYYMLTGVHLFHVALGLVILGVVARELCDRRRRRMSMVEAGATYWHMVDLLWIVIFALLYVMR
ncbi:cytochrome c oxidase subunit 3 family protein [Mycobacterium sp. PS03-16]|uniref:cytochrome c oxidase subunit 3 family protein n=1 Tax=Mycobacterium sp. PS03-16 TaxID=2559611 RepID=UPI001FD73058|nr:cytochrome c oxidase subunit 3 family protein [Mycobacterium sp. PS03-16]